jgi:hypothetical protein
MCGRAENFFFLAVGTSELMANLEEASRPGREFISSLYIFTPIDGSKNRWKDYNI